jgi:hypothetical protein
MSAGAVTMSDVRIYVNVTRLQILLQDGFPPAEVFDGAWVLMALT